jgi:putative membrane protein
LRKRFNINEFIWFVILISFSYYFYKILYSGEIANFMHPKMIKYVYVGFMALGILAIYQFFNLIKDHDEHEIKYGYIMFLIPLFLGFFVSPKGLNAYAVKNRGISVFQKANTASAAKNVKNEDEIVVIGGEIVIDDKNYLQVMNKLYKEANKYKGKRIKVKGFVYKDTDFEKDNFVVARMVLSCCAADAEVVGFMCEYKEDNKLSKDEWVQITGILAEGYISVKKDEKVAIPLIKVEKITSIEEPANKYIYQ